MAVRSVYCVSYTGTEVRRSELVAHKLDLVTYNASLRLCQLLFAGLE